jgi:hypothetical protein
MSTFSPQAWYGEGEFFAPNPEWNAVIQYNLRDGGEWTGRRRCLRQLRQNGSHAQRTNGEGCQPRRVDLRMNPPVDSTNVPTGGGRGGGGGGGGSRRPPAAVPIGFSGAREGGGGGGGRGSVVGPLRIAGWYSVRVTVPGIKAPMTRPIMVEADPLPKFFVADRAARQTVLLAIYDWTKALGDARARRTGAHTHSATPSKADLRSAGTQADSLNARIGRVAAAIDRSFLAVNGQRGPIEGWSGQPTSDQRKAVGYAIDDARKAINDLNKLVTTDIPAAYGGANAWKRKGRR